MSNDVPFEQLIRAHQPLLISTLRFSLARCNTPENSHHTLALLVTIRGNATSAHYRSAMLQAVRSPLIASHNSSTQILATSLVSANLSTEGYLRPKTISMQAAPLSYREPFSLATGRWATASYAVVDWLSVCASGMTRALPYLVAGFKL